MTIKPDISFVYHVNWLLAKLYETRYGAPRQDVWVGRMCGPPRATTDVLHVQAIYGLEATTLGLGTWGLCKPDGYDLLMPTKIRPADNITESTRGRYCYVYLLFKQFY